MLSLERERWVVQTVIDPAQLFEQKRDIVVLAVAPCCHRLILMADNRPNDGFWNPHLLHFVCKRMPERMEWFFG